MPYPLIIVGGCLFDLFFIFAALSLFSLVPVLLMRGGKPVLP